MNNRGWLHCLQEQILDQAKTSLHEEDSEAYRVLADIAERLQKLKPNKKLEPPQLIDIYSPNRNHKARLIVEAATQGNKYCVSFDGRIYTPSGIGTILNKQDGGNNVNGWTYWYYWNNQGEMSLIDDFRKLRNTPRMSVANRTQ